jgi:hypothetical protein
MAEGNVREGYGEIFSNLLGLGSHNARFQGSSIKQKGFKSKPGYSFEMGHSGSRPMTIFRSAK